MSVEDSVSEFEEAYDDPIESAQETFSAEMLEETLELLKPASPEWVTPDTNLAQVIAGMAERNQGCVLVAKDERLVGIFTERDVVRRVVGKVDINTTTVGEVMTEDPEAVSFHDTVAVALNKMTVGGFRHVPLVDIQHKPVGVISIKDIVEYFVEHFPARVLNVAPDPAVRNPDQIAGAG